MKNRRLFAFLLFAGSVRCMPDFDSLGAEYGSGTGGGGTENGAGSDTAGSSSGVTSSGGSSGGLGGSPPTGGKAGAATGGTSSPTGGKSGAGGTGEGGDGGSSGEPELGGEGGIGGEDGGAGQGGEAQGGTAGTGGSAGGTGGTSGTGGTGGIIIPQGPCEDGCAVLYIPPQTNFNQFFTINLNLNSGIDLSDSVFTARVRTVDFAGTTENIQFYASATGFVFWGNNGLQLPLSALADGATLTMDLTSTAGWDNTKVISFGFLLHGAATATTVQVVVEDITVAVKDDPLATPIVGPWLFTLQTDVNETAAELVPASYGDPNILFANPFQPVVGAKALWQAPGAGGADGG